MACGGSSPRETARMFSAATAVVAAAGRADEYRWPVIDPSSVYSPADIERYTVEPAGEAKRTGGERTDFQRDRARVLHSAALRRLAGKTQVVAPGESDFPRTRLTHSLEVAQIGRELAGSFGADPDLVDAACLAHDVGHPPFGHTGEDALNAVAAEIGGFEGNAQNLRILTRLEAKVITSDGRSAGLNPTRALLDAATKYPWPRQAGVVKFGVYADDQPVFRWMRSGAPDGAGKCFEAQVMDWADDVAYCVHDLEDAIQSSQLDPALLRDPEERAALFARAARGYAPDAEEAELAAALDRLLILEWWPGQYDRSFAAQARLKRAASELIGRFCLAAVRATRQVHGPGPHVRYLADVVVPREFRLECAVLKSVTARYVMETERALELRARQRDLLTELVARLSERPDQLEPAFIEMHEAAENDAGRLRAIVDQVASLTDASAAGLHRRLTVAPGT
jgi:dGTPase